MRKRSAHIPVSPYSIALALLYDLVTSGNKSQRGQRALERAGLAGRKVLRRSHRLRVRRGVGKTAVSNAVAATHGPSRLGGGAIDVSDGNGSRLRYDDDSV